MRRPPLRHGRAQLSRRKPAQPRSPRSKRPGLADGDLDLLLDSLRAWFGLVRVRVRARVRGEG